MQNDFFSSLTEFIFCENRPEKSDVIIVPGGVDLTPRAQEAAKLYHEGYGRYIVFTGGKNAFFHTSCPSEAECLRDIVMDLGIPKEAIILETKARHTFENAFLTEKRFKKLNISISSAVLVCKNFHSRRALLSFQGVFGPKVHFSVRTVTGAEDITRDNWLQDEKKRTVVLSEIEKIGNYLKKHMIQIEQSIDLSVFHKNANIFSITGERMLHRGNSYDYFLAKRHIYKKRIPKIYHKVIIFSLDDIFSSGFFRNFLKKIVSLDTIGDISQTSMLKTVTSRLAGTNYKTLLTLWEAYVRDASREAIQVIKGLKSEKTFCILAGYEYDQFLEAVCHILGIHRSYGTGLEYTKDILTGEVAIPSSFFATHDGGASPFHIVHNLDHFLQDEDLYLINPDMNFSDDNRKFQRLTRLSSLTRFGT